MNDKGNSREDARGGVDDYKGKRGVLRGFGLRPRGTPPCDGQAIGGFLQWLKGGERQESRRQSHAVPGLSKTLFILKYDDC